MMLEMSKGVSDACCAYSRPPKQGPRLCASAWRAANTRSTTSFMADDVTSLGMQGPEHSSARLERFLQMVDEHPYKVPEVDESKWFTGGHLGGQIQKVNWQVRIYLCSAFVLLVEAACTCADQQWAHIAIKGPVAIHAEGVKRKFITFIAFA